jgi:hypothetical protein
MSTDRINITRVSARLRTTVVSSLGAIGQDTNLPISSFSAEARRIYGKDVRKFYEMRLRKLGSPPLGGVGKQAYEKDLRKLKKEFGLT